jgi:spoIIIJ-associated protein
MENRATLEVIAPTIEEAIAMGAAELGLPEDSFEIEILDPGSRGLFGLGSRQARVRLTVKGSVDQNIAPNTEQPASIPQTTKVIMNDVELPSPDIQERMPAADQQTNADDDITLHVARETVEELLERMQIKASVVVYHGEPDEEEGRSPVNVDINGKDLSILIGRQAETLNALQYISSLIVGKELGHSIPLVVDVENYRKRRQQQIRHLARRMADQAIKTGRRQVLEPMPANERRIVHIELRDNPQVKTESVGEEPHRKVTILPR